MFENRRSLNLVSMPILLALLCGVACASSGRVAQFSDMARAGAAYAEASQSLLKEVGDTTVDVDSQRLLVNRDLGQVSEQGFDDQDTARRRYLLELQLIRQQTRLLAAYFRALASTSASDVPEAFRSEVEAAIPVLNNLTEQLRSTALIENEALAQRVTGFVATLIVRNQQSRALELELERRKGTIAEVLILHEELTKALHEQLLSDLQFIRDHEYEENVRGPFFDDKALKTQSERQQWIESRRRLLNQPALAAKLDRSGAAIALLLESWKKLLANELTTFDLQKLFESLQGILVSANPTSNPTFG